MILKAEDKQFKLADDGHILWQQDATNPLPGAPVARIRKGDALLKPRAEILDGLLPEGQDKQAVAEKIQSWLERHVHFTLEPLFRLTGGDDFTAPARGIAFQLQEALGILPRADLESLIADLDEEGRKALRARKVRMGPLLVFLPELNKPAAVKMRGLLLTLWQDKELPAALPKDGIVSFSVADQDVDKAYYRSIGYPVYGPRAVRVDMLDRVVCEVYDSAKDGQFQAQHKMAEWLGSNILDLYAVLQAMGHTLIHDPAAEKAAAQEQDKEAAPSEADQPAPQEPEAQIAVTEQTAPPAQEGDAAQAATQAVEGEGNGVAQAEQVKPQLATFRLKRGKANAGATRSERPARDGKKSERPSFNKAKKPADGKKSARRQGGPGDKNKRSDNNRERVYSAPATKVEDSPFAILQQLKQGNDK